jgi:hypothetical protein
MNKQRRQDLLDVSALLSEASDRLNEIREEEQEAFDNMPEGLQCSSRGETMQEAIDTMDEWNSDIEDIKSRIEEFAQ